MAGSEHIEVHLQTGPEAVESRFSGAESAMVDSYATVEQIEALSGRMIALVM